MTEWFMAASSIIIASGIAMGIATMGDRNWLNLVIISIILIIGASFGHHSYNLVKKRESKTDKRFNILIEETRGLRQDINKR